MTASNTRIEKRAGGIAKEIVTTYQRTSHGVVVPTAPTDDFGGREDLNAHTKLPPPIDDPSYDDLLELQSRGGVLAQMKAGSETSGATPPRQDVPEVKLDGRRPSPPQKQTAAGADNHAQSPVSDALLIRLVSAVQQLLDRGTSQAEQPQLDKETKDEAGTYIELTLEGRWGRFRTRVANIEICPNHVALLYTGEKGDDDLRYEPPLREPFKLTVPMTDGSFNTYDVVHYAFITPIRELNARLVLFVRYEPEEEQEGEL